MSMKHSRGAVAQVAELDSAGVELGCPATILVVEDNEDNRDILVRRLHRDNYQVIEAENGVRALEVLAVQSVDLVLLDIMMPEMNGYQVLEALRADGRLDDFPVIVITANSDLESAVKCVELGADDYLPKPFNPTLLRARINASLEKKRLRDREREHSRLIERYNRDLEQQVRQQVKQITSAQMATIFAMSKLAESRDPETGAHLERMREYCKVLAQQLAKTDKFCQSINEAFIENIYAASPLHDIGKVGITDGVLLKPGKLDDDEWIHMRMHPIIGAETLRAVDKAHPGNEFIRTGIAIAEYHHEKWDGSGYPYGMRGEDIPLEARILALGDVYDALTSKRCYKEAYSHETTRGIVLDSCGKHFDPHIVQAFLELEDEFQRIRTYYSDCDD